MYTAIIAQPTAPAQESATALRLRWEAARRQHDKMLLAYSLGRLSARDLSTFEQAEDRAYNAYQAAVA